MAITIAGKADNTLVKMSALAEMADKPADTSAVSDAVLESYGQFMIGMGTIYDTEMAKLEAEKKPLEDVFGKVVSEISNGTYTNEEITQVQDYIDQLREQYKAIPRGKKGETQRQQLQARINKFYNSYEAGGGENLTYAQLIANGEYDANNMEGFVKDRRVSNAESMEIFNKLGSKDYQLSFENDEKNYRIKLKSGETITVGQSELSGIFATDQPDAEGNYDTIDAFYKTLGQAEGSVWDPNEASNNIQKKVFTTDGAFSYIIKRNQGAALMSFHEALHKEQGFMTAEMFSTLGELDPKLLEKYDINDTPGLDAGDFQNEENYKKLISTLTNTKDPDFNRKLAYKFAADWHAGKMKDSFGAGEKMRNKNNNNNNNPTTFAWGNKMVDFDWDALEFNAEIAGADDNQNKNKTKGEGPTLKALMLKQGDYQFLSNNDRRKQLKDFINNTYDFGDKKVRIAMGLRAAPGQNVQIITKFAGGGQERTKFTFTQEGFADLRKYLKNLQENK